jgi:hypothetical protein
MRSDAFTASRDGPEISLTAFSSEATYSGLVLLVLERIYSTPEFNCFFKYPKVKRELSEAYESGQPDQTNTGPTLQCAPQSSTPLPSYLGLGWLLGSQTGRDEGFYRLGTQAKL